MDVVAEPNPVPISAPVPPAAAPHRWYSSLIAHRPLLILLILIGAVLRFSFLDKPPIWFDEAATFGRVSGTYQEMLDALEESGFGPLHYHAYWWIKNGLPMWGKIVGTRVPAIVMGDGIPRMKPGAGTDRKVPAKDLQPRHQLVSSGKVAMTPFIMRLIPAICGTLMIPAMYWLAMEFTRRRSVALVAALLATFSAYLLNYSRDAKMYMELWLFATLNVAALLWWLRTRSAVAWWSWVVSGTIMIGLHLLGVVPLVIELLIVLSAPRSRWSRWLVPFGYLGRLILVSIRERKFQLMRRHWLGQVLLASWRGVRAAPLPWFLVGLVLIGIGPYGYYKKFNQYAQRINSVGWHGSGLQWVPTYNAGRTGPQLLQYAGSAFLSGWEWPRQRDEKEISPLVLKWLKIGCIAIAACLALGVFPWPAILQTVRRRPITPNPYWREMMWLMIWIALPVYVFYCFSISAQASPRDWFHELEEVWRAYLWPKILLPPIALVCLLVSGRTWRERAIQTAKFLAVMSVVIAMCFAVVERYPWLDKKIAEALGPTWKLHQSLWIPRYLGVVLPAILVGAAVLIMRLPGRISRALAIALFVAVNMAQFGGRVFAGSEPRVDLMVRDSIAWRESQRGDGSMKMYYALNPRVTSAGLGPGTGGLSFPSSRYYWVVAMDSPTRPDEIRGGFDSPINSRFPKPPFGALASAVKSDVKSDPKLRRLIVWDELRSSGTETSDKVLVALGNEWARVNEDIYPARDHWTWRTMTTARRRVYEKKAAPTTSTALSPATTRA